MCRLRIFLLSRIFRLKRLGAFCRITSSLFDLLEKKRIVILPI